jgi:hypothetical protein
MNDSAGATTPQSPLSVFGAFSPQLRASVLARIAPSVTEAAKRKAALYNGNWIPIQFTDGLYEGASMVFNIYWDRDSQRNHQQTTDDYNWSKAGLASLYTAILPDNITSAYTITELMLPGLPKISETNPHEAGWKNPFEVRFLDFVDQKFGPSYPWVSELQITVRANSRLRHALAVYANLKHGRWDEPVDFPDSDLVLIVKSLYPEIQNTMFSPQVGQYYESAATAYLEGVEVGNSWIEHMAPTN